MRSPWDWCLAAWGHGTSDHGSQQEARFVQQGDAGSALVGLAKDAWPVVGNPAFHLLEVAFAGTFLRLLAGPAQASHQQAVDMGRVIANTKVTLDQHGDALTGPQVVGPTVRHCPLLEQGFQSGPLWI